MLFAAVWALAGCVASPQDVAPTGVVIPDVRADSLLSWEQALQEAVIGWWCVAAGRVIGRKRMKRCWLRKLAVQWPSLVEIGLTHPRAINRERSVRVLSSLDVDLAYTYLQKMVAGEVEARPLPPSETVEPPRMVVYWPRDRALIEGCSAQAYAALVLARVGDSSIRLVIDKNMQTASEPDRAVYRRALDILDTGEILLQDAEGVRVMQDSVL